MYVDGVADVKCDSSATVTIRMDEGKKLRETTIEKAFKEAKKRWRVRGFKGQMRPVPVATYVVGISGGT